MNLKTKSQLIRQLIDRAAGLLQYSPSTDPEDHPWVAKKYMREVDRYHEKARQSAILMRDAADYLDHMVIRRFVILEVETGLMDGFYTDTSEWGIEEIRVQWATRFTGMTYVVMEIHTKFDIPESKSLRLTRMEKRDDC